MTRRIIDTVLVLCMLLLLAGSVAIHVRTGFFGDKQWEMLYAQMWLGGRHLYEDIFPVSLPLIFWVYALPASIAPHLGITDAFGTLAVCGLIAIGGCIFLCLRLIALHPGFELTRRKAEFVALLTFTLIVRTNPIYFLDREHLFLVLTMPYLIRLLPGLKDRKIPAWLNVATGVAGAIGFCMKPHCLLVFAGLQFVTIVMRRSVTILASLENLIIYSMGIAYLLAIGFLYPEYFHTVLPMALAAYSETRDDMPVIGYAGNALSILIPTFLMFRLRYTSPFRRDIFYLLALLPFFFIYALINNNWAYTYYPLSSVALILTGFVAWEFAWLQREHTARSLPTWPFTAGIVACLLSFVFRLGISLNLFVMIHNDNCEGHASCRGDDRLIAELQQGKNGPLSFGTISIEFARWTRVAYYSGAAWQTRFPQLWMLPKFLLSDAAFQRKNQWVLDYIAEGFASDMNTRKPQVMFVDDTDIMYAHHVSVNLIEYFGGNPHFITAWSHYGFGHRIDMCGAHPQGQVFYKANCSYDVYRRID